MGRPTYEAPTREYTHKHTQTQTNTQRGPTKYGADSRRGGAQAPHQRRAPRPHPQQAASLSRSPTPKLCAPPPRGAVPAARATSTSTHQLTSFSYCGRVSLFRTLSCIRRTEREPHQPPSRSSRRTVGLEEQHLSAIFASSERMYFKRTHASNKADRLCPLRPSLCFACS